jgi:hypothetical protein
VTYENLNWLARQRITHPGEYVIGVMTTHPAWGQSRYDQIRVGLRLVCGEPPAAQSEPSGEPGRHRVHDTETITHLQRTPNSTEKEQ